MHYNRHYYHLANVELGHLLKRSDPTHPEVSFVVSLGGSFYLFIRTFCILRNQLRTSITIKADMLSCEEQTEILYDTPISFSR
jgi:hypothetical protein